MMRHHSVPTWIALLAAVSLLLVAAHREGYLSLFHDAVQLREWVSSWGLAAPVAVILLQATQVLLAPIPGQVVGLVSGFLFGVVWGTIYGVLGTALGSLCALALARTYGRPLVKRFVSPTTLTRLDEGVGQRGLFFFLLAFLLPFLPDDVICFAAGLTSIPIPALMLAVLAGRPPGILVSAWLGARAARLELWQWTVLLCTSLLLALVFLLYGEALERWAMRLVERLTGVARSG
jgi:uncharacterized membrane protein YdjX (TVP38/TMEM64 family)